MSAHHASATLPAPRFSRAQTWTVLFLFFTGIAFLSFNYKCLDDLARQHSGTLLRRLLLQARSSHFYGRNFSVRGITFRVA